MRTPVALLLVTLYVLAAALAGALPHVHHEAVPQPDKDCAACAWHLAHHTDLPLPTVSLEWTAGTVNVMCPDSRALPPTIHSTARSRAPPLRHG